MRLRHITFDPHARPQVANLLTIVGASSPERTRQQSPIDLGDGGAAALKESAPR